MREINEEIDPKPTIGEIVVRIPEGQSQDFEGEEGFSGLEDEGHLYVGGGSIAHHKKHQVPLFNRYAMAVGFRWMMPDNGSFILTGRA